jgi:hypothetical protein
VPTAYSQYAPISERLNVMADLTAVPTRVVRPNAVHGFFDESGKWKDSDEVVAFAGIVGFHWTLDPMTRRWAERLADAGLPYTSMKEAVHFQGPYKKLLGSEEKRNGIVRDLASILGDTPGLLKVASPLETSLVKGFKRLPPAQQKSMGGNPYYGAFEACILGALSGPLDTQLSIVCDLAEEYSAKCVAAFHKMRSRNPTIKERCLGISFVDDSWTPPLQMADMLAYCERAKALQKIGKEPVDPLVSEVTDILRVDDFEVHQVLYRLHGELGGIGEGEIENPKSFESS